MDFEVLKEYMRKVQQGDDIDYYSHLTIEDDCIVFTASKDYDKAFGGDE